MRQKGDSSFISILNKICIGDIDHTVETLLRSQFVNMNYDKSQAVDCVYIFAENKSVGEHNKERLIKIDTPELKQS